MANFNGPQDPKPRVIWQPLKGSQELALAAPCNEILYEGTRGPGKALPVDTPVPTPFGWMRHGELVHGDFIFGSDGKVIRVLNTFAKENRETYKLTFNDGTSIEASDNHLWRVSIDNGEPKNWRTLSTDQIRARVTKGFPVRLPRRAVLQYPAKPLPMDAYMLGAWIGDGSASVRNRAPTGKRTKWRKGYVVEFGSNDAELVETAERNDFKIKRTSGAFTWLSGKEIHKKALFELGLFGMKSETKFIPQIVLENSIQTRLAFLQGLCDTDGTPKSSGVRFSTCSERLANDALHLVRSLGAFARLSVYYPKTQHRQKLPSFNLDFSLAGFVPFRLSRKVAKYKSPKRVGWLNPKVTSVQSLGIKEVSCIQVSASDCLYVAGAELLITHNTDCQLMRFKRRVGLGYGAFWRGVIFDREYKNLDDLIAKSKRWFSQFTDGGTFLSSAKDLKWVWPTGEELYFRSLKRESDYWNFHGQEFPFIGWNELTKYPTRKLYDALKSCNRSSFIPEEHTPKKEDGTYDTPNGKPLPEMPLEVFSTSNPYGPGHGWVKKDFIDVAPPGRIIRKTTNVYNPRTSQREDIVTTQVRLFGSYKENNKLSPVYVASLEGIKDENKRRAWLYGDWNIVAGGAIDDLWKESVHIVPRFPVPKGWKIDRSLDWGSTKPFSVGWWAEANGEEVEITYPDGNVRKFCPVAGSLIRIFEWYGSHDIGSNEGIKMGSGEVADGIKERETFLTDEGFIESEVWGGPADNAIWTKDDLDMDSTGETMERHGVSWTESDKSAGSRKQGLQIVRDRLQNSLKGEGPGLYFMDNCRVAIALLPVLPRDEDDMDDVDTEAEDHVYDEIRYRSAKGMRRYATSFNSQFPTSS